MPSRKSAKKGGGDGDQTKELTKERTRLGSSWAPAAQPTGPPSTEAVTFKRDDSTAPGVPSPTSIDADLTDAPRSPRGRGTDMRAAEYMKARVIKGRIVAQAVVDQRASAIAQPDFDQYMADQIDEATLKQRKEQARATALKECALLTTLESSFAAFAEAVKARVHAAEEYAKAEAAEDDAEAKLAAALQQVEFESLEKAAGDWWLTGAP
jgi:hypothetical protein